MDYPVTVTVTAEHVADLMTTALEGGSGHWLESFLRMSPAADGIRPWYASTDLWGGEYEIEATEFGDPSQMHTITRAEVARGLTLLATRAPNAFADLVSDNHDADTADTFMQFVVLGEVVYG
jgi:hypothetical protein